MKRIVTITHQRVRRLEIRSEQITETVTIPTTPPPRTGETKKGEEKK